MHGCIRCRKIPWFIEYFKILTKINLNKKAKSWIAEKGYDKKMGARPLSRVINKYIKKPLANELLFDRLKKGGTVEVSVKKDKVTIDCQGRSKK